MSGSVNFTLFLKPYASTFSVFQSFSSVKRRSFYALFRLIVCGVNRRSTCHEDQRGPVCPNLRLEWPKTPVLCGWKTETEDKTPFSETSGYEWLGPESESRERSYCSFSIVPSFPSFSSNDFCRPLSPSDGRFLPCVCLEVCSWRP